MHKDLEQIMRYRILLVIQIAGLISLGIFLNEEILRNQNTVWCLLGYWVLLLYVHVRFSLFKCPRCKMRFFVSRTLFGRPFIPSAQVFRNTCVHCKFPES